MSAITSIQSNQIFSQSANHTFNVNTNNNVKTSNDVKSETKNDLKDKQDGVVMSKDGDTLQISETAAALSQKTFVETSDSEDSVSTDEGYTDATAAALASAAGSAGITEQTAVKNQMFSDSTAVSGSSSSSSSSSSSTNNLSQYTSIELKEMLQDGEITQSEYNAEIESRSSSSDTSEQNVYNEENVGTVTLKAAQEQMQ